MHVQDKPDPGNQQREIEAIKFNLKHYEKPLNANDSNAKTHARYYPIRLLRAKCFLFQCHLNQNAKVI